VSRERTRGYAGTVALPQTDSPDALVLGGGGVLGEAWMTALLAGAAAGGGFDARRAGRFLGTSAGSIVAASLAAGIDPASRLELEDTAGSAGSEWPVPEEEAERAWFAGPLAAALNLGGSAAAPLASLALSSTSGGGAVVRRAMLRRVPDGTRSLAELGRVIAVASSGFDERLLIAAVDLASGRRVIFGVPDAPPATVAQAVMASCAIPGFFAPIAIDGRRYVDGGAWSPTNMDALPVDRGDRVLCLNPTGSLRPGRDSLAGAFGPVSRSAAASEALALRHRGAVVQIVNPDAESAEAMGTNLMSRRRRAGVMAAAHAQGRRLALSGARAA
jgi:NTE family protein